MKRAAGNGELPCSRSDDVAVTADSTSQTSSITRSHQTYLDSFYPRVTSLITMTGATSAKLPKSIEMSFVLNAARCRSYAAKKPPMQKYLLHFRARLNSRFLSANCGGGAQGNIAPRRIPRIRNPPAVLGGATSDCGRSWTRRRRRWRRCVRCSPASRPKSNACSTASGATASGD